MHDKAKLGTRFTCFECGCKFYDLNKEVPACPDCNADQRQAPVQDMKSLLSSKGRKPKAKPAPVEEPKAKAAPPKADSLDHFGNAEDESTEKEEAKEEEPVDDDDE